MEKSKVNDFMSENTLLSTTATKTKIWKYMKNITIMAFPTILFFICVYLQLTVNLIFIGRTIEIDKEAIIEGIGITQLYINTTIFYVCIGLACGLETLGSNAYGIRNFRLLGLYYHRAIIVGQVYAIVAIIVHYFTALKVLTLLGIKPEILTHIDSYLHTMIFYTLFNSLFSANFRYLNIISKSHINL
jgi:MATE family multidrug resistance protein